MDGERELGRDPDRPVVCRIRVRGQLGDHWADWFDGFVIRTDAGGDTELIGAVIDQAALHGMLKRVRDVGLTLLSVETEDAGEDAGVTGVDVGA